LVTNICIAQEGFKIFQFTISQWNKHLPSKWYSDDPAVYATQTTPKDLKSNNLIENLQRVFYGVKASLKRGPNGLNRKPKKPIELIYITPTPKPTKNQTTINKYPDLFYADNSIVEELLGSEMFNQLIQVLK
jgi:hypothetical protein